MLSLKLTLSLAAALLLVSGGFFAYWKYSTAQMELAMGRVKTAEANLAKEAEAHQELKDRYLVSEQYYYQLRDELAAIKEDSNTQQKTIKKVNPPKLQPGGTNSQELEDAANQIMQDIFRGFDAVSARKGEKK